MAKFLGILGNLAGKLAGVVFSNNKGGPYVRRKATPTNPNSTRQQAVRAVLATLSASWADLSDSEQLEWADWAANNPQKDSLGNTVLWSGQQAYIACNARLVDAGDTPIDTAPVALAPTEIVGPTVSFTSATAISVAFTGTAPSGSRLVVRMSLPQSGAGNPNIRQSVLVGYSAADPTTPVAMTMPKSVETGQTVNFWVTFMTEEGLLGSFEKDRQTRS